MTVFANHSDKWLKLDLQYHAEDDDFILPDDFQTDPIPPEVDPVEPIEPNEPNPMEPNEPPSQEPTEPQAEPLKFKVKYNHEEQELTYDDAVPLIQKGMNYDKMQERLQSLESDPRLSFVENLAQEQGMNVEEYLQAVQQYQEQEQLNQLIQENIPEELAKEILETRKDRESRKQQQQQETQKQREQADFQDFFQYFKNANGRDFDTNADQIPPEVWQVHAQGVPLKYAYMEHHTNQLASQVKVLKNNENNQNRAPVTSITAHGGTQTESEDDFLRGFNSI